MRAKQVLVFIVIVLCVAGAGGPTAASPSVDACSLLTPAQVSAALGIASQPGQHLVQDSLLMCGWSETGGTTPSSRRVVLDVYGPIGSLTPAERFANAKAPVNGLTKTPASGIGGDAVYVTTPGFGTGLIVKRGASVFSIRVYGFALEQIMAMEKTLALAVVTKL